jgi:hypothetical protein
MRSTPYWGSLCRSLQPQIIPFVALESDFLLTNPLAKRKIRHEGAKKAENGDGLTNPERSGPIFKKWMQIV